MALTWTNSSLTGPTEYTEKKPNRSRIKKFLAPGFNYIKHQIFI